MCAAESYMSRHRWVGSVSESVRFDGQLDRDGQHQEGPLEYALDLRHQHQPENLAV